VSREAVEVGKPIKNRLRNRTCLVLSKLHLIGSIDWSFMSKFCVKKEQITWYIIHMFITRVLWWSRDLYLFLSSHVNFKRIQVNRKPLQCSPWQTFALYLVSYSEEKDYSWTRFDRECDSPSVFQQKLRDTGKTHTIRWSLNQHISTWWWGRSLMARSLSRIFDLHGK